MKHTRTFNIVISIASVLMAAQTPAATTDIANVPLFTSSSTGVKSNVMFILDDSGSMDWDYLPDDAPQSNDGKYGYYASQCNGVAYNPAITYKVPIKADGTYYSAASFTAAKSDGFGSSTSTTNLGGRYYYRYTGAQTPMSYQYTSSGVVTSSTFYRECNSDEGSSPGSGVFTKVTLSSSSAEAQNYANWYTYYRTRMQMMKSATGYAFSSIDSRYRIGFKSIDNKLASGTTFLDINDFDATQKGLFYSKLYSASPKDYTPLRGALSTAGQYFANKAPGQTYDPVQYSCQKNFTILSTDGYWNTNAETSSYGPFQVNNSTRVGQQDGGGTPRPMFDGGTQRTTTTTTWNSTSTTTAVATNATTRTDVSAQPVFTGTPVRTWSRNSYTLGPLTTSITNDSIDRCSDNDFSDLGYCRITVKTSSAHGFTTGMSVTVSGAAPSAYNGTFTITRKDNDEYYYNLPSRPARDTDPGESSTGGGSCPSGQGSLSTQRQTRTEMSGSITTTTTTTITTGTTTTTTVTSAVTPKTRVVIYENGVLISDTPTSGATTTTSSPTASTVWGTPSTTTSSSTTNSITQYTDWANSGSPTVTCASSLPSPNPSTATSSSTTGSAVSVNNASSTSSNTVNGSASTVTTGPVVTESTPNVSTSATTTGGSTDSLADVAMYYYNTDLRTSALGNCTGSLGADVCSNNVAGGTSDTASWQHMTTYTLGLGNSGLLKYDPQYLTQSFGDYYDIKQGTKNWPIPNGGASHIDDLWHAAVNGRGRYFSAQEPTSLATGLTDALDSIRTITGTASAAATSSLQPVQGDNDIYVGQFTSGRWSGDLSSYKIDPATGAIATTATWSAQAQLDNLAYIDRKIYYANAPGTLKLFTDGNLTSDSLQSYFSNFCSKTGAGGASAPEQCATLSAADRTVANTSINLVNYLRGAKTYTVYRTRDHVMGDVINASPLFVGKPAFKYVDSGYSTFASTAPGSTRSGMVYVAANDGMLHAFDRTTGAESWAFIPKAAMPNLYKLADESYPSNHYPMLDGSPVMGDIYVPNGTTGDWKTILVGGMNAGGRSYYALDVTNPSTPKLLWEFSDNNLGLTYSNPIITKRNDGTWVVVIASGYNNVSPGDGNGHLFVLNANTGAKILDIPTYTSGTTPAGSTTTPSGLAKINAYVTSDQNNIAEAIYGGDLLGNVWRFEINSASGSAMLFAQLKSGSKAQPITTKPALAELSYSGAKIKVVYVGTGKYLGTSDLADTSTQTIYALKDTRSSTGLGDVRTATDAAGNAILVAQTASNAVSGTLGNIVNVTANPVNWNTRSGWYMDLPTAGERINISPHLVLSTLFVGTNTPKTDACTVGGTSLLYQLDISSGGAVGGGAAATSLGNVLVMGMTTVLTGEGSGAGKVTTIVTRSDGTLGRETGDRPTVRGALKRTSWRVLK